MHYITLILCLVVAAAVADYVELQPDASTGKDAYVLDTNPDGNYGAADIIGVSLGSNEVWSYLEFTELDDYMGWTLTSAELHLWLSSIISGDTWEIAAADDAWDEMSVTWNNRPMPVSGTEQTEPYPMGSDFGVDVTDLVAAWLDSSRPNYGFCIKEDGGASGWWAAYSSDHTVEGQRPMLILEIDETSVVETTFGQIKAMF